MTDNVSSRPTKPKKALDEKREKHITEQIDESKLKTCLKDGTFLTNYSRHGQEPTLKKKSTTLIYLFEDCLKYFKKGKKKRVTTVPYELVWIRPEFSSADLKKIDDTKEVKKAFLFVTPENKIWIWAKTEEEKNEWVKEMTRLIKQKLGSKYDDTYRVGKWTYEAFGTYEGEWRFGKIHGRGKFVNADNVVFDGDWHGDLSTGFGVICWPSAETLVTSSASEKQYRGGWRHTLPHGPVQEVGEQYPSTEDILADAELTEYDIRLLLTAATVKTYKKGDIILQQGDLNKNLYRIKSGEIALRVEREGKHTVIARLKTSEIFGEMSVLNKQIISATVVAESDIVELYVMELSLVYDMFKSSPGLSRRFHKCIALHLAQRLGQLYSGPAPMWIDAKKAKTETKSTSEPNISNAFAGVVSSSTERGRITLPSSDLPAPSQQTNTSSNQQTATPQSMTSKRPPTPPDTHRKKTNTGVKNKQRSLSASYAPHSVTSCAEKNQQTQQPLPQPPSSPPPAPSMSKGRSSFTDLLVTKFPESAIRSDDDSSHYALCKRWLGAWNSRNSKELVSYYSKSILYRDPFAPQGIQGRTQLMVHHNELFSKYPGWRWEILELSSVHEGFALRCKVSIPAGNLLLKEHSLSLVILDTKGRIHRCEIYFDLSSLIEKPLPKEQGDVREIPPLPTLPISPLDTPIKQRRKDIRFCERFRLTPGEVIIKEYSCSFTVGVLNLQKHGHGTLYLSNRYICFLSKIFGLKTKEVIPIKHIRSIKKKSKLPSIFLKYNHYDPNREHSEIHSSEIGKSVDATLSFTNQTECEEAFEIINSIWSSMELPPESDDSNAPSLRQKGKRVVKESYIQKYARCATMHMKLPPIKVKVLSSEVSMRLSGTSEGVIEKIYDDVYACSLSTYPHEFVIDPKTGEMRLDKVARQGDPIADHYCIERMENRTIVAVADGCGWKEKPKRAALLASRTFVEYVKQHQNEIGTIQDAGKLFLYAFSRAHHKILEGHEEKLWEVGQTTLLGGVLFEINDELYNWGFVCCSVGDCKAYHFSLSNRKVTDITQGSRGGHGASDARESGGRLGPVVDSNPDLQNLSLYFQPVEEGDFIAIVTDGYYDNFDPQLRGLSPQEVGITQEGTWETLDAAVVEKVKIEWCTARLHEIFISFLEQQHDGNEDNLDLAKFIRMSIDQVMEITKPQREYMENNPRAKQPADYKQYPGKTDHVTIVCIKVKKSDFSNKEQELDQVMLLLRHPISGIYAYIQRSSSVASSSSLTASVCNINQPNSSSPDANTTNFNTSNSSSNSLHGSFQISEDEIIPFKGSDLLRWLTANNYPEVDTMAQLLLNFKYICPITEIDSHTSETFSPESLYRFQVFEPILNKRDWELILQGAKVVSYKKGDFIIKQGEDQHQRIFHIINGTCRIEKKCPKKKPLPVNKETNTTSKSWPNIEQNEEYETIVLGTMRDTETFGEISFLEGAPASASVIADSDNVTCYIIEGTFINILFVAYPSLAGRFYHYLASVLARRLRKQEREYFNPKLHKKCMPMKNDNN